MRGAAASAAETASPTIANRFVPLNIVIGAPPFPLGPGRTSGRSDATTADPRQRRGDPWDQRVRLGERPDSGGDAPARPLAIGTHRRPTSATRNVSDADTRARPAP